MAVERGAYEHNKIQQGAPLIYVNEHDKRVQVHTLAAMPSAAKPPTPAVYTQTNRHHSSNQPGKAEEPWGQLTYKGYKYTQ